MTEEKHTKGQENPVDPASSKGENMPENENMESAKQDQEKSVFGRKLKTKDKKEDKKHLEKIGELEASLAELNDKYLRLFSEFDNYRKRTLKERIDLIKNASEEVITDLLPVIDDFERALKVMGSGAESEKNIEGVKLIYNKLKTILNRKGLDAMVTINQPFDTDFHEAITMVPAPTEEQKGKVIDEIEKGYLLNGKVIRFAKVVTGQ